MDARRSIPAVERLLTSAPFSDLIENTPRALLIDSIQSVQEEVRADPAEHPAEWYADRVRAAIEDLRAPTLRRVINATGVVLHTNLGRAPLAQEALAAIQQIAGGYSTLEYDAKRGMRGSRYDHCARLLCNLTGAQDALVVNNNAAALVLALNTFSRGKFAVVSRGELVEIGGSFRVPDIMARSGARMLEVGSTNRTHVADYEAAITARTGALLKVHRSNFTVEGYTADVELDALAILANERGIPLVYDLGSGLLDHADSLGLPDEPTARTAIAAGTSVLTLSGDKLLGGPQAGILLGSSTHIAALRKNPLCRALRVDKLTLAALQATLILHLDPFLARTRIPALRMLTAAFEDIAPRAGVLVRALVDAGCNAVEAAGISAVGGGAAPGRELRTMLVRLTPQRISAATLERRLRAQGTPIIARIEDGAVVIDLRTVSPADDALVARLVRDVCAP